ncbi:Ser-Thr-rich glycosyl-phosphatidyl-inositol-anchored membrane family, partial [Thermoplasmatales archaeon SCGC AB-539-N05]
AGKTVSFAGHGSDSDGSVVAYSWRSSIDGQLSTSASFSMSSLSIGTHTIYFKVQDDASGWSLEDSLSLVVNSPGNIPPNAPNTPSPDNGSIDVSVDVVLNWSCSDPDGAPLIYDVYFDTNITPLIVSVNQSNTTYKPDGLNYNTTYYWLVQAKDGWDATNGSLWRFTTKEAPPPSINLTFPNGYERLQRTNTYNITWNFIEGTGDNVKIELHKNDSQYNIINEDTPNDGSYLWHIPEDQPEGYYYKIKISSTSNTSIFDYSDNNFTITLEPSLTLNILQPLRCYEKLPFRIQILDGNGESVPNATVYFADQKINTGKDGYVLYDAPEIDKDTRYFIFATKTKVDFDKVYISNMVDIIIKNINLKTEAPKIVDAGEKFTIKAMFPGQPEFSQDMHGILVELFNDTIQITDETDANGEVVFTAPEVDQDTFFDIVVYADPVTAQGLILVKKPAGNISSVFTENWLLIVVALIIALILALFLWNILLRRNKKLSINAPIHVDGDTEFAVKVRDTKDKPVADARVEFNNIKNKTDKNGVAVFKTPPIFSDVKELCIIANKDNTSSTVSLLIGGNMKKAKEQSKKKLPSNEEVPTFSPAIKNIQPSFADIIIERKEDIDKIRKISSTSDDMIYRLVDTVIDRHRKNK